MDSKNFAIGVLATTAVILLVGVILLHSLPAPAQASGMAAWGRDYVFMTVGRVQQGEQQVYVVDAARSRMNLYSYDLSRKEIRLDQSISLEDMRKFVDDNEHGNHTRRPAREP